MHEHLINLLNEKFFAATVDDAERASKEERIRVRAYLLSQRYGHPQGRAEEFWRTATAIENDC